MSIIKSNAVASPPASGGGSPILSSISEMNSLRFDGTSTYLSKNNWGSATNSLKGTFSCWTKISAFGTRRSILSAFDSSLAADLQFEIGGSSIGVEDEIFINWGNAGNRYYYTDNKIRDASAWYHVVLTFDIANATPTERIKIYVNNNYATTSTRTPVWPGTTERIQTFNGTYNTYIGCRSGSSQYYTGYLANIHFIDGQALTPHYFGAEVSGIWVPKAYSGTYGANGFHLDFHPDNRVYGGDGKLTKVLDASGENNNDWDAAQ